MSNPITLALAEQSELTRSGLEALVRPYDVRLTAPGDSGRADVTLFDTDAPLDPAKIHDLASCPGTGHLVLYSWNRPTSDIRLAMSAGARGFLPKSLPTHSLIPALTRITAGETVVLRPSSPTGRSRSDVRLTRREQQIVQLIASGIGNAQIAEDIHLSLNTVKSYIRSAYRKMGVTTRAQAVAWVFGGLPPQGDVVPLRPRQPAEAEHPLRDLA